MTYYCELESENVACCGTKLENLWLDPLRACVLSCWRKSYITAAFFIQSVSNSLAQKRDKSWRNWTETSSDRLWLRCGAFSPTECYLTGWHKNLLRYRVTWTRISPYRDAISAIIGAEDYVAFFFQPVTIKREKHSQRRCAHENGSNTHERSYHAFALDSSSSAMCVWLYCVSGAL